MELDATDKRSNQPVPGIIFLRGDAVAVYIIIEVEDTRYVILTKQIRAPLGKLIEEIPAGMMDADNNFTGVAIKEISEETGLDAPNFRDLIPLGDIIPSAGGCDEKIKLFLWKTKIKKELLEQMKTKIYGAENENESIKLVFIPFEEYENELLKIGDVKAICAHQFAKQKKLLDEVEIVKFSSCFSIRIFC
jgi:ADP-sugar diphosphatase